MYTICLIIMFIIYSIDQYKPLDFIYLLIILLIMLSIDQYKSLDFIYLFIILVTLLNNLNEMTPNDRASSKPPLVPRVLLP